MVQLNLNEIDEARLRLWVSVTIPLVYRGEMTVLELLLRMFQMLNDIGKEEIEVPIDHTIIVEELLKNESFYPQVEKIVNDHLDSLNLGGGNIYSYISSADTRRALGVYLDKNEIYQAYSNKGEIVNGITCLLNYGVYNSIIFLSYQFMVEKYLVGNFADENLTFHFLTEKTISSGLSRLFSPYISHAVALPFGDQKYFMVFTRPEITTSTYNKKVRFAVHTSGITLNKLNTELFGFGQVNISHYNVGHDSNFFGDITKSGYNNVLLPYTVW